MFIRILCESQWVYSTDFILYCHCISILLQYHQTQHFLLFNLSTEHVLTSPQCVLGVSAVWKAIENYMTDYIDFFYLLHWLSSYIFILLSTFKIVGTYYIICRNLLNVFIHDCSIYYIIALYSNIYWCYSSLYLFSCI